MAESRNQKLNCPLLRGLKYRLPTGFISEKNKKEFFLLRKNQKKGPFCPMNNFLIITDFLIRIGDYRTHFQ